jgi:glycerophosphoryl diester phosphodiesterase
MRSSPSRQAELRRLGAVPFAHRGLHGPGIPENSGAAFRAAAEAGFGIELDVQACRGGEAFVFHDEILDRLAGRGGRLADLDPDELAAVRLGGSDEAIPSLSTVLTLIGGRVPLLIEVKAPGRQVAALCRSVETALAGYEGAVGVMSFNPEVGRWFARHSPDRLRGLVASEQGKKGLRGRIERHVAWWRSSADFLAYDIRDLPSRFAARHRPVFTWTVRTDEERALAARYSDQAIFEVGR